MWVYLCGKNNKMIQISNNALSNYAFYTSPAQTFTLFEAICLLRLLTTKSKMLTIYFELRWFCCSIFCCYPIHCRRLHPYPPLLSCCYYCYCCSHLLLLSYLPSFALYYCVVNLYSFQIKLLSLLLTMLSAVIVLYYVVWSIHLNRVLKHLKMINI